MSLTLATLSFPPAIWPATETDISTLLIFNQALRRSNNHKVYWASSPDANFPFQREVDLQQFFNWRESNNYLLLPSSSSSFGPSRVSLSSLSIIRAVAIPPPSCVISSASQSVRPLLDSNSSTVDGMLGIISSSHILLRRHKGRPPLRAHWVCRRG